MNNSPRINKGFRDLAHIEGESGREDYQHGWHEFFSKAFEKKTILDVGAGLGGSKNRMEKEGHIVTTQDVAPKLPVDISIPISEIESKTFDIVTAFDVIEHIDEDLDFMKDLWRISVEGIFLSTPNYNISKCRNSCHVREYTPKQLLILSSFFSTKTRTWASFMNHGYSPILLEDKEFINTKGKSLGIFIKKIC